MALSRDAVAQWLWQRFGSASEAWESLGDATRGSYLEDADALALQFKLPLDADGPGIARCRCGHPVGEHREGENACRGQSPRAATGSRAAVMVDCGCKSAVAAG